MGPEIKHNGALRVGHVIRGNVGQNAAHIESKKETTEKWSSSP